MTTTPTTDSPAPLGLVDRLLGAIGLRRADTPGPGESATPSEPGALTTLTLQALREMLAEHDRGVFLRSALVAELVRRDPDLYAALKQRLDGLLGLPLDIEAADDSEAAKAEAEALEAEWPTIAARAAQREMVDSAIMLGFAFGQLVWEPGDDAQLVPRLLPWPSACVEHNEYERCWYAQTATGRVLITPGTGAWVFYAPASVNRPWTWGAIRCIAESYLRAQNAAGDASKHAEVHGLPVWKAYIPSGSETQPAGKRFLSSIRNMGRNAVVPLPRGDSEATSYDLKLEAAQTDAYRIYEFLLRFAAGKFRLVLLGQDLTSQNNLVGTNASSETGADTLDTIIRADAVTWGECCTAQIVRPLATYRGKPVSRVCLDAEPDADFGAEATALKTAGEAAAAWKAAGFDVDLVEFAERFGVPGKVATKPATPPPALPAQTDPAPVEGDDAEAE